MDCTEPLDLFEWEIRVQAYQNNVSIAMCNRVGQEGDVTFAGLNSIVEKRNKNRAYRRVTSPVFLHASSFYVLLFSPYRAHSPACP